MGWSGYAPVQSAGDIFLLGLLSLFPEVHIQGVMNPEQQEKFPHCNLSDKIVCSSIVTRSNPVFIC